MATEIQAAVAKPAAKVAATGYVANINALILAHPVILAFTGGFVIGIGAYHLANKLWFNKEETTEEGAQEQEVVTEFKS